MPGMIKFHFPLWEHGGAFYPITSQPLSIDFTPDWRAVEGR